MAISRDLTGLSNHLFAQLETLGNPDLTGDELKQEIIRAKALTEVGGKIIDSGRLMLDAQVKQDNFIDHKDLPKQLE